MDDLRVHYVFLIFLGYSVLATSEAYRIGIGIADVTGPSVGIPFVSFHFIYFIFFLSAH